MTKSLIVEKQPFSDNLQKNEATLKERLGLGISFDVGVRKLPIFGREIQIYYVNGLCDSYHIIEILAELMNFETTRERKKLDVKTEIKNHLAHIQVDEVATFEDGITWLLSGLILILIEGETEAFVVDVRSYPGRGPEEPDTERVVRGARDGFTENVNENTALIRRRIRDEGLRNEIIHVGVRSKTDVCISYIEDIADPDLVNIIKQELGSIRIDGITMADKVVEEYFVKRGANPFPLVRYTERPDVAATHLLEGHVLVLVDTSPSVIITPTTFFHHVQHAEEYRQAPVIGTFLRWVRFFGMILSLFILPVWLLFVIEPSLLPPSLEFIGPKKTIELSIFMQIILAEIGIEMLRMAAIHTPSPLATALGLVAAILIGEIAINVGLLTPEVILYVALGAIGTFATPSYELGIALKITRLILLVAVVMFKVPGLVIGTTILLIVLTSLKSLNKPYLWPLLPLNPPAAVHILIRASIPTLRWRPSIVNPQDEVKQTKG